VKSSGASGEQVSELGSKERRVKTHSVDTSSIHRISRPFDIILRLLVQGLREDLFFEEGGTE
jgi:hypothetical protein